MNKILVIPLSDPVSVEYLYFSTIAGRTFLQRLCWLSKKAGYKNSIILNSDHSESLQNALNGAPGKVFQTLEDAPVSSDCTLVFLKPDIFPTVDFLKQIPAPEKKETLYLVEDNSPVLVIKVSNIPQLSEILSNRSKTVSLEEDLRKNYPAVLAYWDNRDYYSITDHDDISRVEKSLYRGLIKETESFMSRHVERKISLAITGQLINTSMTPNRMSFISIGVGLIGGLFLSFPIISLQIFGAILFLSHSILDGCDGEIARLKYMESRLGGLLDFWGDNVVHSAVFLGIGVAWENSTGSGIALWCSGLAITGTLLSASLICFMTMRSKKDDGPLYTSISHKENKDRWVRIADYLSRRDFIYLVVLLAILGQVHWFLVLAALGAPLFFLFTLWSNFK